MHQVQTEGEDALVDIPALVSTLRTQRGTMVQASVSWMGGGGPGRGELGVWSVGAWGLKTCPYMSGSTVLVHAPLQLQHMELVYLW